MTEWKPPYEEKAERLTEEIYERLRREAMRRHFAARRASNASVGSGRHEPEIDLASIRRKAEDMAWEEVTGMSEERDLDTDTRPW